MNIKEYQKKKEELEENIKVSVNELIEAFRVETEINITDIKLNKYETLFYGEDRLRIVIDGVHIYTDI